MGSNGAGLTSFNDILMEPLAFFERLMMLFYPLIMSLNLSLDVMQIG